MHSILNSHKIEKILSSFCEKRSPKTVKLYLADLEAFTSYLGVTSIHSALLDLLTSPQSQANLKVMHYRSLMYRDGLKPATINRRLSTLRSIVKDAWHAGHIQWKLDVNNLSVDPLPKANLIGKDDFESLLKKSRRAEKSHKISQGFSDFEAVE